MTEPSIPEEGSAVVVLDAFPDGSLSMDQVDALEDGNAIDLVAPLVIDIHTGSVTHLDLVIDDTHYYVGWNRGSEQWERILVALDKDDGSVLETAISVVDDETGEVVLGFDSNSNPDTEEIAAFIWEYVEYTYPETERLYNVMDDALEEVSTESE